MHFEALLRIAIIKSLHTLTSQSFFFKRMMPTFLFCMQIAGMGGVKGVEVIVQQPFRCVYLTFGSKHIRRRKKVRLCTGSFGLRRTGAGFSVISLPFAFLRLCISRDKLMSDFACQSGGLFSQRPCHSGLLTQSLWR